MSGHQVERAGWGWRDGQVGPCPIHTARDIRGCGGGSLQSGLGDVDRDDLPPVPGQPERVGAPAGLDPRVYSQPFNRNGMTVVPLTRKPGGLQAFKQILPAGPTDREPDPRSHDGYHRLYVLNGRLRLVLGDQDRVLTSGEVAESTPTSHTVSPTPTRGRWSSSASSAPRANASTSKPATGPLTSVTPERTRGHATPSGVAPPPCAQACRFSAAVSCGDAVTWTFSGSLTSCRLPAVSTSCHFLKRVPNDRPLVTSGPCHQLCGGAGGTAGR